MMMRDGAMLGRLKQLESDIRVAIIGTGCMGTGLFRQCQMTPGIECVAVADVRIGRAIACVESAKRDRRVVHSPEALQEAISRGEVAVCEEGDLLAECDAVDVLIEASNSIIPAGRFAVTALEHRKHVVLMNAEIDLIFGPFLMHHAREMGVVCTSCDGDQYGVIKHLIDELQLWGFELVMAGNIKGFLDRYADPTTIVPEADKRNLDYKMATAYTDGTKLCVEMAIVANGFGLSVAVPGMQGPRADHVRDVFRLFDLGSLREDKHAVVDYILGAEPGGGVFAVGYCDDEYQRGMLSYYKMGDGPFYLFYRPFHLCHVEAMACVAEAYLDGHCLLQPHHGFSTNVYAYAKRDLRKGERLDGIGGYTCYGLIEDCGRQGSDLGLPICLAEDVTLERDVSRDEKVRMDDVSYDRNRFDYLLYSKAVEVSGKGRP